MKHLITFIITLTFISLSVSKDPSPFVSEVIDGKTFSGVYGKDYAEIGKKITLLDFYFIGIRCEDEGYEICLKPNKDMEYACYWSHGSRLVRYTKNSYIVYESPIGEYWYNEGIKITQLYYFIKELEDYPHKKQAFLDFHAHYFKKPAPDDACLEDFINIFEPDITKKQFIWKLHQKSFNELSMELDCRQLTRKITKKADNKV